MAKLLGTLEVGQRFGAISAREVDEREVVADDAERAPLRRRGERPIQIGRCFWETPRVVVEQAAVQGRRGQALIEFERAGVVADRPIGLPEGGQGQGPVVVALWGPGRERDADPKGARSLRMAAETI